MKKIIQNIIKIKININWVMRVNGWLNNFYPTQLMIDESDNTRWKPHEMQRKPVNILSFQNSPSFHSLRTLVKKLLLGWDK